MEHEHATKEESSSTTCEEADPDGIHVIPEASTELGNPTTQSPPELPGVAIRLWPLAFASDFTRILAEVQSLDAILLLPAGDRTHDEFRDRIVRAFETDSFIDGSKLLVAHRLGELLKTYKGRIGLGRFEDWIVRSVVQPGRSRSTVGEYMRIASVPFDEILVALNSRTSGTLSINAALEWLRSRDPEGTDRRRRGHRDQLNGWLSRGPGRSTIADVCVQPRRRSELPMPVRTCMRGARAPRYGEAARFLLQQHFPIAGSRDLAGPEFRIRPYPYHQYAGKLPMSIMLRVSSCVPPGSYLVYFVSADLVFSENRQPRLRFTFEVIEGPWAGTSIVRVTGTVPTEKNACGRLLAQLLGRDLEEINLDAIESYRLRAKVGRAPGGGTRIQSVKIESEG